MTGHETSNAAVCAAPLRNDLETALAELAAGRPILLVHESLGRSYLVAAADRTDEDVVRQAAAHGRGLLRVALMPDHLERLGVPRLGGGDDHAPIDVRGAERPGAPGDRVATLRALADPGLSGGDLVVPGHLFPVPAGDCSSVDDACVARMAIEAARFAGCAPVAAFCEVQDDDGRRVDRAAADALAGRLDLAVVTLRELLVHRERIEPSVTRAVRTAIPTRDGPLEAIGYVGTRHGEEYVAFVAGTSADVVRVHAHRRCQVSDVFGGVACRCGEQLRAALAALHADGDGVVVYYGALTEGFCAGASEEAVASWAFTTELAGVLRDLGVERVDLTSNGPLAVQDMEALGLAVVAWGTGSPAEEHTLRRPR